MPQNLNRNVPIKVSRPRWFSELEMCLAGDTYILKGPMVSKESQYFLYKTRKSSLRRLSAFSSYMYMCAI